MKNANANEVQVLGRLTNANAKVVHATNVNAAKFVLFGVYKVQMRLKWQSASEAATANK